MLLMLKDLKRVFKFLSVIARPPIAVEDRLDRAIQMKALDYPAEPDNDNP
jgi:hypothetical protein